MKEVGSLAVPAIRQAGENTCWAACYEMVDQWRGKTRNRCEYVNLQTGKCVNCLRPHGVCDKARPVAAIQGDWKRLGYTGTEHQGTSLDEDEIRRAIKKKRPVQGFVTFKGQAIGHFVLIVGIERRPFTADTILSIHDPAVGNMKKSFGQLNKWGHWVDSWVVQ